MGETIVIVGCFAKTAIRLLSKAGLSRDLQHPKEQHNGDISCLEIALV